MILLYEPCILFVFCSHGFTSWSGCNIFKDLLPRIGFSFLSITWASTFVSDNLQCAVNGWEHSITGFQGSPVSHFPTIYFDPFSHNITVKLLFFSFLCCFSYKASAMLISVFLVPLLQFITLNQVAENLFLYESILAKNVLVMSLAHLYCGPLRYLCVAVLQQFAALVSADHLTLQTAENRS